MSFRHTYDNLHKERLRIHGERVQILAQIEQLKRDAETLLMLETDLMRMQDNMQVATHLHAGTEARQ